MPPPEVVARLRAAGCVFAEEEAALLLAEAGSAAELERLVAERVTGTPLEVVLGWVDFCGLRVSVTRGVFVPRRRTELLITCAVVSLAPGSVVVDLCCGTGAVGAALRALVPGLEVYAADLDPAAVACASRNLPPGRVFEGDLFAALPIDLLGRVEAVVCNAPYVPTDGIELMPPEARLHENRVALDGGPDGVRIQARVIDDAAPWLATGGRLLIETSARQAPLTVGLMTTARLERVEVHTDEALGATVVAGGRSSSPSVHR